MPQHSVTVRNARLDAIETTIGASPILRIRSGLPPANCAAADTGTVLVTQTLPSDWLSAAAAGQKAKTGTWSDPSADATGLAGHYRIYDSTGTTCHEQGTVAETWQASKAYLVNQQVANSGNVYRATAAGTSAGSGGPTGTGGSITDGGVTWAYVAAGPDMLIGNTSLNATQPVDISSYTMTEGNA